MGRSYNLNQQLQVFNKIDGKNKLKEILLDCCDEDFNGNNGCYLIKTVINGEDVEISKFEACWLELQFKDEKTIIQDILDENYKNDDYYHAYDLQIIDRPNEIIFSVSIIY